jgi:aminoglycoside phosphotransferase (APT) family kinase protein
VEAVIAMLADVHAAPPPRGLPRLEDAAEMRSGWARVAADPAPFLALGLASSRWLEAALPALRDAENTAPLCGGALLHQDVRSDNLALGADGARLVDWNWAAVGNPDADVAFWLPSLRSEGGPPPEHLFRGDPRLTAVVSGWFASSAGLPPPPAGPRVREVQLRQLRVALPWAAAALGLPRPGGASS